MTNIKLYKSPLRYAGGKGNYIKNFIHLFPNLYSSSCIMGVDIENKNENNDDSIKIIDVFCGGGSVTLYLAQIGYKNIVMNDLDYNLYNFWNVLKFYPNEMINELINIWNRVDITNEQSGKDLYNEMKEKIKSGNDINKAISYYILNRIVFAGMTELTTFSPTAWQYKYFNIDRINKLKKISNILQGIEVSNCDYKEIFNKYKNEKNNVFYFLDPPYNIKDNLYKNHHMFNHDEFIDNLFNIDNKFILTYDCDEEKLNKLKKKYKVDNQEYSYCLNHQKDKDGKLERRKRNEYLIYNNNNNNL
jgi:DNA adenine methylase